MIEAMPFAPFLSADVKIDQLGAGAYRDPGNRGTALRAILAGFQQAGVTMNAFQILNDFIFRKKNG